MTKTKHASASNQETEKETNDTTQHIVSMTPGSPKKRTTTDTQDTSSTKNSPTLQEGNIIEKQKKYKNRFNT